MDRVKRFAMVVQPQLDAQFAAHFRGRFTYQAQRH